MNNDLNIGEKLEEIKKEIGIWEIKENLSKEEVNKLNETFELHWKFINLLTRILEKEEQFKEERYKMIDQYWRLVKEKKDKNK